MGYSCFNKETVAAVQATQDKGTGGQEDGLGGGQEDGGAGGRAGGVDVKSLIWVTQ